MKGSHILRKSCVCKDWGVGWGSVPWSSCVWAPPCRRPDSMEPWGMNRMQTSLHWFGTWARYLHSNPSTNLRFCYSKTNSGLAKYSPGPSMRSLSRLAPRTCAEYHMDDGCFIFCKAFQACMDSPPSTVISLRPHPPPPACRRACYTATGHFWHSLLVP